MDVPTGTHVVEVFPLFIWPDTGSDSLSGLWFYGAMLNGAMTDILGNYAAVSWGYGP